MPVPPNITAATAIALTGSGTTVQQVDDGATTYDVWYKYVNASGVDQVISIGTWGDLGGGGYEPDVVVWGDEAATIFIHDGFPNGSFTLPIPAGFTYWFDIANADGLPHIPSNLNLKFLVGPAAPAEAGNVFIRSASMAEWQIDAGLTGLQGAFIDADASAITGFIPQFITGEAGDILSTGRTLFIDEYGSGPNGFPASGYYVYLYDSDFTTEISNFVLVVTSRTGLIRTHVPTDTFYIARNDLNNFAYRTVAADGTLGTLKAVTNFGVGADAIGVNEDETLMYISHAPASAGLIKVWDIINEVFLADLTTGLADHKITDILVLPDDSLLACYFKTTVTKDCFVRHYQPNGTLTETFTFTYAATLTSTNPRLGYSADADAFWLLNHLSTGYADVRKVQISTGDELFASLTPDVFQSDIAQADPPLPQSSDSCPIIEIRVSLTPSGGAIIVTKDAGGDTTTVFDYVSGGGLSPTTFTLTGGGSQEFPSVSAGSGYSVTETPPDDWQQTSVTVSNGSPVSNITVDDGETVTVTFTNALVGPERTTYAIRRLRRAPHLSGEQFWQFFQFLQIGLQTGVGISTGQGEDPQLMLRWSDDGGFTWSNEHWVSAGRIGEYSRRAIWRKLGRGRDRVFEVVMTDPVFWAMVEAEIQAERGTS